MIEYSPLQPLIYRYRLTPSHHQADRMLDTAQRLRRVWNALVGAMKHAEHECRHGRKAAVVERLAQLLASKRVVGMRAARVTQIASDKGVTREEANRLLTLEQVERDSRTIVRKDGCKARRASIRSLAIRYAIETVCAQSSRFGVTSKAFWGVIGRFRDSTSQYICNRRSAPRFKRACDSVPVQFQVQGWNPITTEWRIDLSEVFGRGCKSVQFIQHRPLPDAAVIKQVAIVRQCSGGFFACVFVDVPEDAARKAFPARNGEVAGIDPGRKTPVTISSPTGTHQSTISPPLLRDRRFMRKTARLMRKLDRQRRLANPDNYTEDGSFKRGRRQWTVTKGMLTTQAKVAQMRQRLIDVRTEHYRLQAREVLSTFDHIGIGTWKPNGSAPGEGRVKRAQARKDADNALGQFTGILKDFAARSVTPKVIYDVNEAGTTRQCVQCSAPTGPSGVENLSIREWTCPKCGTHHIRDFASAQAIAKRTQQIVADTHSANEGSISDGAAIKPARRAARRGKRSQPALVLAKAPVEQEVEAVKSHVSKVSTRASATMMDQSVEGARASHETAAEGSVKVLAVEPAINVRKDDHNSHSWADDSRDQELAA